MSCDSAPTPAPAPVPTASRDEETAPGGQIDMRHDNCYDFLRTLADRSVQLFLLDPPYGITRHPWDAPLDWDKIWPELWRCARPDGVVAIHASMPFTIDIIQSQRKYFKYWWVWHKSRKTGFLNANRMPLRNTEEVCIFYKRACKYRPQMTDMQRSVQKHNGSVPSTSVNSYKAWGRTYSGYFPTTLQYFAESTITMKPVSLEEYLIKTYTDEGDVVCDITMHTGVVAKACVNTRRSFKGCEIDKTYYDMALQYVYHDVLPTSKTKRKPGPKRKTTETTKLGADAEDTITHPTTS